MRMLLRALLSAALLLGSGLGDRLPVAAEAHESCCCGTPAGQPDGCPCPKPEGNRTQTPSPCATRPGVVAALPASRSQARPRTEPRPEPARWAQAREAGLQLGGDGPSTGRDPDLGRHLARLQTFRI